MIVVTIILTLITIALCYLGYKVYKLNKWTGEVESRDIEVLDMAENFNSRTDALAMGWERKFDEMRTNQIGLKDDIRKEISNDRSRIILLEGLLKESKIWKNY